MYQFCPLVDDREFINLTSHRELLCNISVSYTIGIRSSAPYLPTLAGDPAGDFLPVRRGLDGVFLQLLAVGLYACTKPGKFHDTVEVASHAEGGCQRGRS